MYYFSKCIKCPHVIHHIRYMIINIKRTLDTLIYFLKVITVILLIIKISLGKSLQLRKGYRQSKVGQLLLGPYRYFKYVFSEGNVMMIET